MREPNEQPLDRPTADMLDADTANGESDVLRIDGTVDVRFRAEAHSDVARIVVVGEFNEWSTSTHPMVRVDDHFELTLALRSGRRYRYKYLVDDARWENDWLADDYVANEHGGDDSVLDLTTIGRPSG